MVWQVWERGGVVQVGCRESSQGGGKELLQMEHRGLGDGDGAHAGGSRE